jgi:hypothetical protein
MAQDTTGDQADTPIMRRAGETPALLFFEGNAMEREDRSGGVMEFWR